MEKAVMVAISAMVVQISASSLLKTSTYIPAYANLKSQMKAKLKFEALKKNLKQTMVKSDVAKFLSHVKENYPVFDEAVVVPPCLALLKKLQGSLVDFNPISLQVRLKKKKLVKVFNSNQVLKFATRKKDLPLTFGFYPDISSKEKKLIIIAAASKGCSSRVLQPDLYSIKWITTKEVEDDVDVEKSDDADQLKLFRTVIVPIPALFQRYLIGLVLHPSIGILEWIHRPLAG